MGKMRTVYEYKINVYKNKQEYPNLIAASKISVGSKHEYDALEMIIDQLVDFACEIREAEPEWTNE